MGRLYGNQALHVHIKLGSVTSIGVSISFRIDVNVGIGLGNSIGADVKCWCMKYHDYFHGDASINGNHGAN